MSLQEKIVYDRIAGFGGQLGRGVAAVLFCVLLNSPHGYAASDGETGASSEGDFELELTIPNLVRITGVADMNFGSYSGSGVFSRNDNVCVYTNSANGQYLVTAQGSGAASAFTVSDGASHTIPYTVRWNDQTGTSGNIQLDPSVSSATQSGAHTSSETCSGGDTANFEISFTQGALLGVPAGTYTGVLTLIIEPA